MEKSPENLKKQIFVFYNRDFCMGVQCILSWFGWWPFDETEYQASLGLQTISYHFVIINSISHVNVTVWLLVEKFLLLLNTGRWK